MVNISELTGSPWHTEKMVRKEGDPKRHKSRCVYYVKQRNYCKKRLITCAGSAHCDYYREEDAEAKGTQNGKVLADSENVTDDKVVYVKLNQIKCDSRFTQPSVYVEKSITDYFKKYSCFDRPIVVNLKGGEYWVEDNYPWYYVAKKLKIIEVQVKIIEKNNNCIEKKIQLMGQRVKHRLYGTGTILESNNGFVQIGFDSGQVAKLQISTCIAQNLISIL